MARETYKWKSGFQNRGVPAKVAAEEVQRIGGEKGKVTPSNIVDEARDKRNPLHAIFDWSDTVAAKKWRIEQAGQLMRSLVVSVVVVGSKEPVPVRAWVSVKSKNDESGKTARTYVPIRTAVETRSMADQVLDDALSELRGWRDRYIVYGKLAKVVTSIDRAIDQLKKIVDEAA